MKSSLTIKNAQSIVKKFAKDNKWLDEPCVDKFDHLHEELVEMSKHLRYKSREERIQYVQQNQEVFKDGIGDLLFGLLRLANQLGVDVDEAFEIASKHIMKRYIGNSEQKQT